MGDRALLVELGDEISPPVNQRVQELFTGMDLHQSQGILDLVPSYRSLLVIYDPLRASLDDIKARINNIWQHPDQSRLERRCCLAGRPRSGCVVLRSLGAMPAPGG